MVESSVRRRMDRCGIGLEVGMVAQAGRIARCVIAGIMTRFVGGGRESGEESGPGDGVGWTVVGAERRPPRLTPTPPPVLPKPPTRVSGTAGQEEERSSRGRGRS